MCSNLGICLKVIQTYLSLGILGVHGQIPLVTNPSTFTAVGDFDQKPYVSGDADCSTVQLGGDEDYLLLACDGFFDTVKPEEVPGLVLGGLREPRDPEEGGDDVAEESALGESVAQKLVAHAKAAGSNDNITVLVVFLRPPQQLLAEGASAATAEAAAENSDSQSASGQ